MQCEQAMHTMYILMILVYKNQQKSKHTASLFCQIHQLPQRLSQIYTTLIMLYNKSMERRQLSEGHKIVLFVVYVAAIFFCHICTGILQEKIYKVPYPSHSSPGTSDIFTDNVTPFGISSGIACLIGYFIIKEEELNFDIPVKKLAKIAACDLTIHILLITALLRTDYTTLQVVNSSSLLSVVLVGAFCSGVNHNTLRNEEQQDIQERSVTSKDHIGPQKIWIGLIMMVGIIMFSYFSPNHTTASSNSNAAGGMLLTILMFFIAIVLQGFRPDFIAQIKQQYHPSPLFLYFSISGIVFILTMITSIATLKISYFITFALSHDQLLTDLACQGILNSVAYLFIYKLISIFRQHIYPLVAGTRKCLTICINVLWFGHHLVALQWLGIFIVFTGIIIEISSNYNLARKILPNDNIRNRQGKNYNKVIAKDEGWSPQRMEITDIGDEVEGI